MAAAASLAGIVMEHDIADLRLLPAHLGLAARLGRGRLGRLEPSLLVDLGRVVRLSELPGLRAVAWRLRGRPWLAVGLAIALVAALYAVFPRLAGFPLTQATFAWGALRIVPCFAYGCAVHLLWRSNAIKDARIAKLGAALSLAAILGLAGFGAPDAALTIAFGALILCLASLTSTGSKLLSGPGRRLSRRDQLRGLHGLLPVGAGLDQPDAEAAGRRRGACRRPCGSCSSSA